MKNKLFNKKNLPYYIILIITFLVGHPLLSSDTIYGHDLPFHIFRVRSSTLALLDGQIIPMIDPNVANGFGYAYNIFYGILPTYIVGFLNFILQNWTLSYNIFLFICIYLCGIFMYNFVKDVFKNNNIGLIASIIYISFPYFLTDIYIRQALGEFLAFMFIPILFHELYNLINNNGNKYYYITIGTTGLLLSHNLSTLMTAIFAVIYLLLNIKKVFKKNIIKKIIISMCFAILMSLITLGPLLEAKFSAEYEVFNSSWMKESAENMNGERLMPYRLVSSNLFIQYETHPELLSGCMPFDLGFPCIISLIALIFTYKKYNDDDKRNLNQFLILGGIALLLTSVLINWNFIPSFFYIFQFPWRFMLMSTFFLSIISACSIYKIFENFDNRCLLLIMLVCFMSTYSLTGYANYNTKINNSIFEYASKLDSDHFGSSAIGSNEYLTHKMALNLDYIKTRKNDVILLNGSATITNYIKEGTQIFFTIETTENCVVELPLTYYKGYKENNNFDIIETKNGLVGIKIPKGNNKINVKYSNTTIQLLSYIISISATIIFIIYTINYKKRLLKKQ